MWIGFFMFYMIATDYIRGILFSTALSIFHAQQFVTGIQFGHPMTLTILAICFALFLLAYIWGSGAVLLGAWLTNMVVVLSSLVFGMSLVQALYWIIMLCGAMIIHYGSTVLAIASINSHIGTKKFSVTALSALEIAFLGLLVICIADILYFFF
ncbi:MAG: hypothetical protein ACMXYC_03850 [Candidatus Woesearchaeota archaeon]